MKICLNAKGEILRKELGEDDVGRKEGEDEEGKNERGEEQGGR